VADAVAELHEVEYVVLTAGAFDMLLEVVVEDDEHLLELLNAKIRKIEGVQTTETSSTCGSTKRRTSGGRLRRRGPVTPDQAVMADYEVAAGEPS